MTERRFLTAGLILALGLAACDRSPVAPEAAGAGFVDTELEFLFSPAGGMQAAGMALQHYYRLAIRLVAEELGQDAAREIHAEVADLRRAALDARRDGDAGSAAHYMAMARARMLEVVVDVLGESPIHEMLAAARVDIETAHATLEAGELDERLVERALDRLERIQTIVGHAEHALAAGDIERAFRLAAQARMLAHRMARILDRLVNS